MVEKLIKDGKVAVIYSPGYGSGWSTWNTEHAEWCVFDKRLAELVLAQDQDGLVAYCTATWPNADGECELYLGSNVHELRVEWLRVGTKFRINEYDGYESVQELGDIDLFEA